MALENDLLHGAKLAADYCGLTEQQLRYHVRTGRIPVVRMGRKMFFSKTALEATFRPSTAA